MQNVAKTRIKNPEANKTFTIIHATLLSATFHNAHESPRGCEKVRGAVMTAQTRCATCHRTHLPEMQLNVNEDTGLKDVERSLKILDQASAKTATSFLIAKKAFRTHTQGTYGASVTCHSVGAARGP